MYSFAILIKINYNLLFIFFSNLHHKIFLNLGANTYFYLCRFLKHINYQHLSQFFLFSFLNLFFDWSIIFIFLEVVRRQNFSISF